MNTFFKIKLIKTVQCNFNENVTIFLTELLEINNFKGRFFSGHFFMNIFLVSLLWNLLKMKHFFFFYLV